jgi:predicted transcriptional regulator
LKQSSTTIFYDMQLCKAMSKKLKKPLTPGQVSRAQLAYAMADAVRRGRSTWEVAAEYGKSETTVRLACSQHKVDYPRAKRGPKSKAEERKSLAEAVRKGRTAAEVARAFGQPYNTVLVACREQNVKLVTKNVGSMRILAAILSGKHQTAVAQELGITRQRVSQVVQDAENAGVFAAVRLAKSQELP